MSGHSKWSTIKHKKAATDKKRGKLFSKLSRAIIVAAKEGGGDPSTNNSLAVAVQKARDYSMPKDNIERAIARGAGGADSASYEVVTYEGYGPGGAAFVVEALTDNRNRTAANVRSVFTKSGGSLGQPGSVAWMFERKGVVIVEGDVDGDDLFLAAADAGADDVTDDEGTWQVTSEPTALAAVRTSVEEAGFEVSSAELTMLPKTMSDVDEEQGRKLVRMIDLLEDDDDVQDVYFNFDIPEALIEA
jgi:YebC/PmpR family DNA-binding regulatory protein